MRVAFVVQRYGLEVNGGAELEARLIAEHLAPHIEVDILTTCATDYMTWENAYEPGEEHLNGVRIHRFPVQKPRDVKAFNRFSQQIIGNQPSFYDQIHWMSLQGPDAPGLFRYIQDHEQDYDLFLFFTYLYATTYVGLQLVPHKSLLFPTAHDETWIYFDIFRTVFNLPRGFIFNSEEEAAFVRQRFHNQHIPGAVLGVGLNAPQAPPLDIDLDDYVLYLGRVDISKGCQELFQFFLDYKKETCDPVKLVLIGAEAMPVPSHPDIISLGFMQQERFSWLQQAQLSILPSPHESLSLSTLESWAMGVPVLVNGEALVLKGHCQRSNGGLYYQNTDEFTEALKLLRSNADLRQQLAERGQAYVNERYNWAHVVQGYLDFFDRMHHEMASIHNSQARKAR